MGEISSPVNFVCWLSFGVCSTPVLLQWHIKDPDHSAKSVGGSLHLNMHTPLPQRNQSGLTMPLSRHSVGTYQETSSHVIRQGTLGHSCLSLLSHCGLNLAKEWNKCAWANLHFKKRKKSAGGEWLSNILLKSLHARKKPPPVCFIERGKPIYLKVQWKLVPAAWLSKLRWSCKPTILKQ